MVHNLAADVDAFTSNAFLVPGERTVLVDAGADFDAVAAIEARVDDLDAVLLTHGHPDHVGNVEPVTDAFDVPVWGYDDDLPVVDRGVEDGESVAIGDHQYVALHTPGHATDHLCFHSTEASTLFSGDLVFPGGNVGRTDIPGSDRRDLRESVLRVAERVGGGLQALHAGHGPSVTAGASDHVDRARQMVSGHE